MKSKEGQQLYWIYSEAKQRCINPKHPRYKDYGLRGIKFLLPDFKTWCDFMGPRPPGYELDRIDNNGHYELTNLRWVSISVQQKNKRKYKTNSSGICGVGFVSTTQEWVARCNTTDDGKRKYLYVGKDFFEACCARLSWETNNSEVQVRNRRGTSIKKDNYTVGI